MRKIIKEGFFMSILNEGKLSGDFSGIVKETENFYKICDHLTFSSILYRSVDSDRFFPLEKFKIGDVIEQILPMSTSVEPEFPAYVWISNFLLKIHVSPGNGFLCLEHLDKEGLMYVMFDDNSTDEEYESEVILSPGIMKIIGLSDFFIPSLDDYFK